MSRWTSPARGSKSLSDYQPLPSVWTGDDASLLEQMLKFYPRKEPHDILDATVNAGRIWKGTKRKVIGLDINPAHRPTVVGDNRDMPFDDASFDVVVYDPPHVPGQGNGRTKDFVSRFGLTVQAGKEQGYSLAFLYPPFVAEAFRVLRPEGMLLAKIADYVFNHRFHWAHCDFLAAASAGGFCPCDCIVKVRNNPIIDPKWKSAHHCRKQHCFWLVCRKSTKCE